MRNQKEQLQESKRVSELGEENGYTLLQMDYEIQDMLDYVGKKDQSWSFLYVKRDESGADIDEVWGTDAGLPYLDSWAYLIYKARS